MKSPWRFLADLTSRRKKQTSPVITAAPEKPAEDQAGDQDAAPARSATKATSTDHSVGTTNVAAAASPVSPPPVVRSTVEPSEVVLPSERAVDIVEPEVAIERPDPALVATRPADLGDVEGSPIPSKNRSKRIKAGSVQVVTPSPFKSSDDLQPASLPAQPLTFLEEMAALDEEISALKAALALKLKLQNAQLKKMLERFAIR